VELDAQSVASTFQEEIQQVVSSQVNQNKEAIFFIYDDGRTSKIYQGQATQISLTREEEARILSNGNVVGSVHSHPSGFDPSTIDIITGTLTTQEAMGVAVPIYSDSIESDFVLTSLDLSNLSFFQQRRLIRSMRRSSVGLSEALRDIRKQASLQRFDVSGTRTHEIEFDGITFPVTSRPSKFNISIGKSKSVREIDGNDEFI